MRHALKSAVVMLASVAAAAVVGIVGASPAQAATIHGCWGNGGSHSDGHGGTYGTVYCNAYLPGSIMDSGTPIGYLNAGTSWFACQDSFFANPYAGGPTNTYWLYTQADTPAVWGWFPANRISGGLDNQPIPGLRDCDQIAIFTGGSP
jgi:hypothetical protein